MSQKKYTRIPNIIFEQDVDIAVRQIYCYLAYLCRETGFCTMTIGDIARATGMSVCRAAKCINILKSSDNPISIPLIKRTRGKSTTIGRNAYSTKIVDVSKIKFVINKEKHWKSSKRII